MFPHLTVGQNIAYGLRGTARAEVRARVGELLETVSLDTSYASRRPHQLSGGQQQRVALARALARRPVLMLLDEPTTGLDPASKLQVQQFVREALEQHDATILLTTHDMDEAERLCDRIAFLVGGSIIAEGTPLELRTRVANGRPLEQVSMETVFLELTGKSIEEDEEVMVHG